MPSLRRLEAALALLERAATDDVAAVVASYLDTIAMFGFDACAAGAWVGVGRTREHRFYFNTWPREWLAIYERRDVFREDPVIAEARRRMTPFLWSEMERAPTFTARGRAVMRIAYDFGWVEGLAIPVHGPGGYQGIASLAALRPVSIGDFDREMLRAMSLAVHDRCRVAAGFGASSAPAVRLTGRELECMQWVAADQTDRQVAASMGVSPATVHFHVESVKRKLGTHSRARAVALLLLRGMI